MRELIPGIRNVSCEELLILLDCSSEGRVSGDMTEAYEGKMEIDKEVIDKVLTILI